LGTSAVEAAQSTADINWERESLAFRKNFPDPKNIVIERDVPGQPHKGKVLALIFAHADDHAGTGTAAKLINEGYTGYLIRVTNEDKTSSGTVGEAVELIADDTENVGKAIGCTKTYNLGYNKHDLEDISIQELRARFIFLFRLLQVDTVITFDPWSHYEENPDHYWTGRAVEAATWHSTKITRDYPEHSSAGLRGHGVREKYYFYRGPDLVNYTYTECNRIVDISSTIEKKINADIANKSWGLGSRNPEAIRKRLTGDEQPNPWGVPMSTLTKRFGLKYAEFFHHMGG
ncbi:PIG-L deacetylase family protein, partial [Candidatus Latescibacterota bacterium]